VFRNDDFFDRSSSCKVAAAVFVNDSFLNDHVSCFVYRLAVHVLVGSQRQRHQRNGDISCVCNISNVGLHLVA